MLTPPWTTTTDLAADTTCTVIASRLPLRSRRSLPALLAHTWRARRALAIAPGLAGYRLGTELRRPALWTVSAWSNRAAIVRFDHSEMHRRAKRELGPVLLPPTFVVWNCPVSELPVTWTEVRRRVAGAGG